MRSGQELWGWGGRGERDGVVAGVGALTRDPSWMVASMRVMARSHGARQQIERPNAGWMLTWSPSRWRCGPTARQDGAWRDVWGLARRARTHTPPGQHRRSGRRAGGRRTCCQGPCTACGGEKREACTVELGRYGKAGRTRGNPGETEDVHACMRGAASTGSVKCFPEAHGTVRSRPTWRPQYDTHVTHVVFPRTAPGSPLDTHARGTTVLTAGS